jgi:hypothetical protein
MPLLGAQVVDTAMAVGAFLHERPPVEGAIHLIVMDNVSVAEEHLRADVALKVLRVVELVEDAHRTPGDDISALRTNTAACNRRALFAKARAADQVSPVAPDGLPAILAKEAARVDHPREAGGTKDSSNGKICRRQTGQDGSWPQREQDPQ